MLLLLEILLNTTVKIRAAKQGFRGIEKLKCYHELATN